MNTKLFTKVKKLCEDSNQIVLFDSEEEIDWGRPSLSKEGILLTSILANTHEGEKSHFYPWADISLLCTEGFKIKKLKDSLEKFERQLIYKVLLGNKVDSEVTPEVWVAVHIGDPLELFGKFTQCDSGLFVEQNNEASAIILPTTELIFDETII